MCGYALLIVVVPSFESPGIAGADIAIARHPKRLRAKSGISGLVS
jgi:hypothetical protein